MLNQVIARLRLYAMELTDDESQDLAYMVHDKDHVGKRGTHIAALDKAIKLFSAKSPKVYRGVYPAELHIYDTDVIIMDGYSSFSEHLDVAKSFATKTKTIVWCKSLKAFPLWRWGVSVFEKLRKDNFKEFDSSDGDFLIQTYKDEAEWILPIGYKFKVMSRKTVGNFTFIELSSA